MGNHISQTLLGFRDRCLRFLGRGRTNLLALPPELLHSILKEVGQNSFGDLCRSKAICSALRDVADKKIFMKDLDLLSMHRPYEHLSGVRLFFNRCLDEENPSAVFIKGCWDFFRRQREEVGLNRIRQAAQMRYPLAMYVYANLSFIMNLEDQARFAMPREFMREFRQRVDRLPHQDWPPMPLPTYWLNRVQAIPVGRIYDCPCCPATRWEHPWNERVKIGAMCSNCFRTIQALWFANEFPEKVKRWPEQHAYEDQMGNWRPGDLWWLQDVNRTGHCIKMVVVCVLVLFLSFLVKLL